MSILVTIIISISGSLITGGFLLMHQWLNKHTELLKATDSFRFEVFKKRLNVYQELNILISDILFLSVSVSIQTDKKIELTKASLRLQKLISSNSIMISSEIGILLLELLKQKQDVELTRKTINAITKQMELELHLEKTAKINDILFKAIKDEKQKESNKSEETT